MVSQTALSAPVATSCTQARATPNSSSSQGLKLIQLLVLFGTLKLWSPFISASPRTVMVTQSVFCEARKLSSRSRSGIIRNIISSENPLGDAEAVNCK